jgi:peptidoglycan/xylan/chitin deacetylase (PgdA/CDA1 family)
MTAAHWENVFTSLRQGLSAGQYIRTVNFHNTPAYRVNEYERQLEHYARHFSSVTEDDLETVLTTGQWHKAKPGLILAFYNGYRNNVDVMKPLLERYGFVGWFFIPSEFVSTPPRLQKAFALEHTMRVLDEYEDARVALSWDEVRELDKQHVIASHTKTHSRITFDATQDLEREIVGSQRDFERELGHFVKSFAWLFGSEYGVHEEADKYLHEAGYHYLFSNFKIQKLV